MTTGDVVYSLRFFTHQSAEPEPRFELGSTAGESRMLTARLNILCVGWMCVCFFVFALCCLYCVYIMLLLYSCLCVVWMHFIMFFYVCVCVYDLYLMCVCVCLGFFLCNKLEFRWIYIARTEKLNIHHHSVAFVKQTYV